MIFPAHNKRFFKSLISLILAVIMVLLTFHPVGTKADNEKNQTPAASVYSSDNLTYYYEVYAGYDFNKEYSSQELDLDINSAVKEDGSPAAVSDLNGRNVILWNDMTSGYTYDFSCNEGLYYIEFEYSPLTDSPADIIRSVLIDGKSLFAEADNIKLPNEWITSGDNYIDINGDEKAAPLIQRCEFKTTQARDLYGLYSEPLLFDLKDGRHSLTLQYVVGSVAISSVKLVPYRQNISYSEYIRQQTAGEFKGSPIIIQGEAAALATERVLSGYCEKDPSMTPYTLGVERINSIGGWNWRSGNEEITWKVDVPEDGLYKLSLRVSQNYNNLVTYRQILIDDAVPFNEVSAYPFYSHSGYVTDTIASEGTPYLFALTKGEHTISLRVVTGEMSPLINQLQVISRRIADTVRQIQTITGTNPDPNFDYELAKKMPWLLEDLRAISDDIRTQADYLRQVCKGKPPVYSTLTSDIDKINAMIKRPRSIPLKLSDLVQVQGDLADNSTNLKYMPLAVDYIEFMDPGEKIVQHKPTFWEKLQLMFVDFIQSFTKDYSNVKNDTTDDNGMKTLNIWVSRGREWGETIQRMADEEFTPKYNVRVNVNILPIGSTGIINGTSPLLLSIVSGNTPDIAMGSDMDTPIELAIRGSVADISVFPDYAEIAERFNPAAIAPLTYQGKVYALPETMDIPLLIYRTDIFNELGISVPDTWEELWTYTIPKLKQNNANFSISSNPDMAVNTGKMAMYSTFLFQNGGDFYSEDGKSSLLNSDAAFNAFSDWTKNFTQYISPQSVNFYQQMRTGDIPLGVGFLGDYLMLDIAAPELYGRFDIAPIPGKESKDGTIVRYGAGSVSSAMIFENSTKLEESWEFLKWWTDENTQIRFDSEIEAKIGPTGRWFSANLNAFYSLPWGQHRSEVIKDWMPWYKNPVNTLGGYMTPRAINNAWTRTVMSSMKTRDSLEQAFDEISIEMERKQMEYGVKE